MPPARPMCQRSRTRPQIQDQSEQILRLKNDVSLLDSSLQDTQKQSIALSGRLQVGAAEAAGSSQVAP